MDSILIWRPIIILLCILPLKKQHYYYEKEKQRMPLPHTDIIIKSRHHLHTFPCWSYSKKVMQPVQKIVSFSYRTSTILLTSSIIYASVSSQESGTDAPCRTGLQTESSRRSVLWYSRQQEKLAKAVLQVTSYEHFQILPCCSALSGPPLLF